MRAPAWAAAWWQRRRVAAAERELARLLGYGRRWRAKPHPPSPGAPLETVELRGGSRDGQLYRVPASYGGPDGLPDAIAISNRGRPELYERDGQSRHYRYRGDARR